MKYEGLIEFKGGSGQDAQTWRHLCWVERHGVWHNDESM